MLKIKYFGLSKLKESLLELFSKLSLSSIIQGLYYNYDPCTYFLCTTSKDVSLIEYHDNDHRIVSRKLEFTDFVQQHENSNSDFVVLSSCYDLILGHIMYKDDDCMFESLGVLNPASGSYLVVDRARLDEGLSRRYEFGYSPYTKRYKVLRFDIDMINKASALRILNVGGTDDWRTIDCNKNDAYKDIMARILYLVHRVILNGSIHWLICVKNKIVGFDIDKEEFKLVPNPDDEGLIIGQLSVFDGSLCALANHEMQRSNCVDVWVMKEYGVRESWTRLVSIHDFNIDAPPRLIHVLDNGKFLFHSRRGLSLYDPIEEKWDEKVAQVAMNYPMITHFFPSLLPFNGT